MCCIILTKCVECKYLIFGSKYVATIPINRKRDYYHINCYLNKYK